MAERRRGSRIWRKISPYRPAGAIQRKKSQSNDIFGMETPSRSILYTPEGRKLLRRHKGIVKEFLFARRLLISIKKGARGKMDVVIGPMRVERFFSDGDMHDYLYRVKMEGKVFFIKEQGEGKEAFQPDSDFADAQMKTLSRASVALRRMKGVKVAQYHLAWRSGNRSFL
ncbi:MAG: hypothetical protein AABW68_01405, partial [archaeon]